MSQVAELEVEKLFLGKCNVRKDIGNITELTASIREKGVLQPIIVRPVGKQYEIIVGSRRFEASKRAGLKKIPAVIREMDDAEALAMSLIENVERGDLDLKEEGEAYKTLLDKVGSIREIERQTGIRHERIVETLEAYNALKKLEPIGIKVIGRLPTTSEERRKGEALPKEHAIELERAFRAVRLSEKEKANKYQELAKAIAPLEQKEAETLLKHFKMYPEKPVQEIEELALSRIPVETRLPAGVARELDEIARSKGASLEEVIPEAVEKYIEISKPEGKEPKEELAVREGIVYTIGELDCDRCGRHYVIKCDGKRNWLE